MALDPRFYFIVTEGPRTGSIASVDIYGGFTIGRDPQADFRINHLAISRLHVRIFNRGDVVWVEDLNTKNGTVVDGTQLRAKAPLRPGDAVQLADVVRLLFIFEPVDGPVSTVARLRNSLALRKDYLVATRSLASMRLLLEAEFRFHSTCNLPFSVLCVDIDQFDDLQRVLGPTGSDAALATIAATIERESESGTNTFKAQRGFVVLCAGMTAEAAMLLAERIRIQTAALVFKKGRRSLSCTVSVGVSSLPAEVETAGGMAAYAQFAAEQAAGNAIRRA